MKGGYLATTLFVTALAAAPGCKLKQDYNPVMAEKPGIHALSGSAMRQLRPLLPEGNSVIAYTPKARARCAGCKPARPILEGVRQKYDGKVHFLYVTDAKHPLARVLNLKNTNETVVVVTEDDEGNLQVTRDQYEDDESLDELITTSLR